MQPKITGPIIIEVLDDGTKMIECSQCLGAGEIEICPACSEVVDTHSCDSEEYQSIDCPECDRTGMVPLRNG